MGRGGGVSGKCSLVEGTRMLFTFYLKGWRWLTASAVWYSVYACTWVQTMTEALRVNETGLFFLSGLVTADRSEDVLIL